MTRRSSGVEGEVVEEEEFVGTGEVVRIEKTEEVGIIIIVVVIIAAIFSQSSPNILPGVG